MGNIILLHKPDFQSDTILEPTITATWVKFVKAGEEHAGIGLNEELESFLVFSLIRFAERTDLLSFTLALEYLKDATEYFGKKKEQALKEVGDVSLIIAGIFPERSHRLGVPPSYFSEVGQLAFTELADSFATRKLHGLENLYRNVGNGFPIMTEVLHSAREEKIDHNLSGRLTKKPGFLSS
jgi:hypothetical protein